MWAIGAHPKKITFYFYDKIGNYFLANPIEEKGFKKMSVKQTILGSL